MQTLESLLEIVKHFDKSLITLAALAGNWIYAILFAIIFCETGLIITAFLPGDSLLFATGTLAAISPNLLNINVLFFILLTASITGNIVNYYLGKWLGLKLFTNKSAKIFNPTHISHAHAFYEKHGNKAIVLARFIPIIRTFAPFVAGLGYMNYKKFFFYNLLGAFIWIGSLLYGSYLFGNIPLVRNNFNFVIISIIILSLIPSTLSIVKHKFS